MAIPHLVAHRGHMELYPENTLIGIEAALQCGAAYVEFDIQSTADGELVIFHDTTLERTTGVQGNLFEMSYDEIKNIRTHEPERFSLAYFKEHIPTLKQLVGLFMRYPQATAFAEIKYQTVDQFGVEAVVEKLLQELEPIARQAVVISYHHDALKQVKATSEYPTGWILRKYDEYHEKLARELNPDYLIIQHRRLPVNQEPWQGDWQWMVYDITDPELALHYASFNVPLVESRDICRMLEHPVLALDAIRHEA